MEQGMTDYEFSVVLDMIQSIVETSKDKDEAVEKIKKLPRKTQQKNSNNKC